MASGGQSRTPTPRSDGGAGSRGESSARYSRSSVPRPDSQRREPASSDLSRGAVSLNNPYRG
ncbi:MAG: hypothetical protein IJH87_06190, partial [Atopobiaceae bacterium]|nr:hypothetical protein [Atopobiaceae bacterium]